ncbi:hypothetical protein AXF42_Ash016267 [Apostasia shenzhenica]|uniref:Uncharacterized protein n=1 Tax=Apostasia shenzhenica TaxID=1088818 RepID=A0A2H9ZX81_9ASPA|nr:hypothetical protein AXF42_Ash016267 [Apostasia shenzhenica]
MSFRSTKNITQDIVVLLQQNLLGILKITKILLFNLSIFKICHYYFQPRQTYASLPDQVIHRCDGGSLCVRPAHRRLFAAACAQGRKHDHLCTAACTQARPRETCTRIK